MNKKHVFVTMLGFILVFGFILTGCATPSTSGDITPAAAITQSVGPQLVISITDIPAEYNGKLGWLMVDTGSSAGDPTVAWAYANIHNGSVTLRLLDWVTDQAFNKTGNYYIALLVYEDFDSVGPNDLYYGYITSIEIGERTSLGFYEFIKY